MTTTAATGAGTVVVDMTVSLDGFVSAEGDGPGRGLGVGGEALHAWLTAGNLDPTSIRPETGVNATVFDDMTASGAVVTGRHTIEWAGDWSGDHHDGVPVYVLTRTPRDDRGLLRYRTELAPAIAEARVAAGERHVMVHGATSVQALLREGLVDQFVVTVAPVLLGRGRRLFEDVPPASLQLLCSEQGEAGVVHLRYAVER